MNRKLRTLSAAVLLGAALIVPASAAHVEINGARLSAGQGWVEDGASRVTLLSLSQSAEYDLSWDGAAAALSGPGFTPATAAPGQDTSRSTAAFCMFPGACSAGTAGRCSPWPCWPTPWAAPKPGKPPAVPPP